MYLEPTGMLLPYFLKKNYTNDIKGIMPTNGDFRSRREGSWAGDKQEARDAMRLEAKGNSFLLFVIVGLTTLLDY